MVNRMNAFRAPELMRGAHAPAEQADLDTGTASLGESLLSGFETAYQIYNFLTDAANGQRAQARSRSKPEQLEAVDADTFNKTSKQP
jgi:hypothetical protein